MREVLTVLADLLAGRVGQLVAPTFTDLVKDRISVLGRLVEFGAKFLLEGLAINMEFGIDVTYLGDGRSPP